MKETVPQIDERESKIQKPEIVPIYSELVIIVVSVTTGKVTCRYHPHLDVLRDLINSKTEPCL